MKVTIRKRMRRASISLYLDIYSKNYRKQEALNLHLIKDPKTPEEIKQNKRTMQLAEAIKVETIESINKGGLIFNPLDKRKSNLILYFQDIANKKLEDSRGNYGTWCSMIKHLSAFAPENTTFKHVDYEFVNEFRYYLDKIARKLDGESLSQNSKYSYFNKFKAGIKQAIKDRIISVDPSKSVAGFKQYDPQREYLSHDELQSACQTECLSPLLKKAFIFSCLTGLRWSDIVNLKWSDIYNSKELGYHIRFQQKKTRGNETLPISDEAFFMLGEPGNSYEKIFEGLRYSVSNNKKLKKWMRKAGVYKPITFHCARHTYATLQLSFGTDIYTVSKLLGHRELKTTQVYTKIIDENKRLAANRIKLNLSNHMFSK